MDGNRRMETEDGRADMPDSADVISLDLEGFIADVVNSVNDLTIDGFNSMEEFVLQTLGLKSEEDRHALKQGVDIIYGKLQDTIDESLNRWESICRDRYFNSALTPLMNSHSKMRTRDSSANRRTASSVEDGEEEALNLEMRSLQNQLVAAHRDSAKMRRELSALEKQLTLRREVLTDVKSLNEGFDGDLLEEVLRSAYLLKDTIVKASSSQDKKKFCLQDRLQQLRTYLAGDVDRSPEELMSALKMPNDLEVGDPEVVNLLVD